MLYFEQILLKGVKFMCDYVNGVKITDNHGCLMTDKVDLGKTLECITCMDSSGKDCIFRHLTTKSRSKADDLQGRHCHTK